MENENKKVIYIIKNNDVETIEIDKQEAKNQMPTDKKNIKDIMSTISSVSITFMGIIVSIVGIILSYSISQSQSELQQLKYNNEVTPVFFMNQPYDEAINDKTYRVYEISNVNEAIISEANVTASSFIEISIATPDVFSDYKYGFEHFNRFTEVSYTYDVSESKFTIYSNKEYTTAPYTDAIVEGLFTVLYPKYGFSKYFIDVYDVNLFTIRYKNINNESKRITFEERYGSLNIIEPKSILFYDFDNVSNYTDTHLDCNKIAESYIKYMDKNYKNIENWIAENFEATDMMD